MIDEWKKYDVNRDGEPDFVLVTCSPTVEPFVGVSIVTGFIDRDYDGILDDLIEDFHTPEAKPGADGFFDTLYRDVFINGRKQVMNDIPEKFYKK